MHADQARVAAFTAASCSTSLAMSLLSVLMLASGPFWTALSQFCMIVEHFSSAVCSAAGGLGGLAVGGGTSMPSSLSADPGCSRKPYCSASAVPRYPQPPQGCANDRFRGLRLMAIGTLPLLALSGYPAAVMHATARAKSDSPGASPSLLDWPSAAYGVNASLDSAAWGEEGGCGLPTLGVLTVVSGPLGAPAVQAARAAQQQAARPRR